MGISARVHRLKPEYGIEACLLGLFMILACAFTVLLEHPASPVRQSVSDPVLRRLWMGFAMGGTCVALIYSPWGRRSGAHLNPAVTWTFYRLGRVSRADAWSYVLSHFIGALSGVAFVWLTMGSLAQDSRVRFAATTPGPAGAFVAFAAETAISFLLMTAVLWTSSRPRWAGSTGVVAGALVALYIAVEAPLSGMSMNPARSFASAVFSGEVGPLWIYFTAPILGMELAAQGMSWIQRAGHCAKLVHDDRMRCLFCGTARS